MNIKLFIKFVKNYTYDGEWIYFFKKIEIKLNKVLGNFVIFFFSFIV